ncbi:hypothetical protein QTP86_001624, partial [Hemibagrus guttatus]
MVPMAVVGNPGLDRSGTKTGNQRYIYISTSMTWSSAQDHCRTYYTDLASARDATENSVIAGMIPGLTWIGLFRDKWKWVDKNNFTTTSWLSANIDNALGDENCGFLNNGQAADAQCSDIMPFFCYSETTVKQQIIRVKVWSSQDVNDPAVKEAMLDKVKQKLRMSKRDSPGFQRSKSIEKAIKTIVVVEDEVVGGDEEVMGKFGVQERKLEGQMVVDFAKRMGMAVVNTYFQKREEHRVTYKSGAEVIRETGRKVLGVSSGRRKEDKETWWWNEKVQDSIQRKRLAKKKWDMDRTEKNRQEYKELQRRVKREVSKAKQK